MSSALTVFSLDDYVSEIKRLISRAPATGEDAEDLDEETPPLA